jgi:hypothetical protein
MGEPPVLLTSKTSERDNADLHIQEGYYNISGGKKLMFAAHQLLRHAGLA